MSKPEFKRVEFHRTAIAMVPHMDDPDPGTAFWIESAGHGLDYDYCTCKESDSGNCKHSKELEGVVTYLKKNKELKLFNDAFRSSMWETLATCLNDAFRAPLDTIHAGKPEKNNGIWSLEFFHKDKKLLTCTGNPESVRTLLERTGINQEEAGCRFRFEALGSLYKHTMSETETQMSAMGRKTRRQSLEESFWYRVFYHCFLEHGFNDIPLEAGVDGENGTFSYNISPMENEFHMTIHVPRDNVKTISLGLKKYTENYHKIAISNERLKSVMKMSMDADKRLVMALYLRYSEAGGEDRLYERKQLERFRFGDLYYLPDENVFAEIESPDTLVKKFKGKFRRVVKQEKVPEILESFADIVWGGNGVGIVDDTIGNLKIFKDYETVTLNPQALEQDWLWLSVEYGFGDTSVNLFDIYQARKSGKRFIPIDSGWVDVGSVDIEGITAIPGLNIGNQLAEEQSTLKLSGQDLFRLMATSSKPVEISGQTDLKQILERIVEMTPSTPFPSLSGMTSGLRNYQKTGSQWLTFLYENNFSGLLCDDMGLGKTHQVMAFMVWLKEIKHVRDPFLIVAPVTVMSHWESKLTIHAPALKTVLHYGADRNAETLNGGDVVLTSFGVLRRDHGVLSKKRFTLAVFDEAQQLKNKNTQVYKAALGLNAAMKLGVTGTPIENTLEELKALMDISFPGYLGTDEAFEHRYVKPVTRNVSSKLRDELSRIVKPFTLRRLKASVLDELPEKIEDIRTCRLSEAQARLYRQAIAAKKNYLDILKKEDEKIPYMHIFALLTLLKQICNHPALVEDQLDKYGEYDSGKWELFKELLGESMASGQKTVIYTQYVGMVKMISSYLKEIGIDAVSLTGASRNRGKIIDRFNNDPACKVFVGSLLAGGTGIDLVSASVVIHYDRWWNAAKEDQATDRVHRIGQTRGVQVFKLVTKGTLEEKISAIIDKKRNLMDSIVTEDDPNLLKTFDRNQLMELLAIPEDGHPMS